MNLKILKFRVMEKIYQFLNKDSMKIRIDRYRYTGMQIGGVQTI